MRRSLRVAAALALLVLLSACGGGQVRRVSEPAASIQQLTVRADGSWSVDLRLQNYSTVPMRFDGVSLAIEVGGEDAGTLVHAPAIGVGPESADVVTVAFAPAAAARLVMADALAGGRGVAYSLQGGIDATPTDRGGARSFKVKHRSALNAVPGLPGVLR